ncbi:protein DA1-related 5-like [Punica granatum]|uniref:Protein DA1-related 5-like n=1 Tax=Punica granatum TaxID=22663 RepID=A0A6P8D1G0_PUNGR|nr:protein DA1-related 5-like [Punica granatum]
METVLTTVGTKVLENLVDQLLQVIVDAKNKAVPYTDILDRMQKRVIAIAPLFKQIEELNTTLNRSNDEVQKLVDLLQNGQFLVKKCTEKVRWWNCGFKRPSYAGELLKLEEELNRYFQEIVQLQQRRDQMEMLVKINQIHATFPETGGYGKYNEGQQCEEMQRRSEMEMPRKKNQINSTVQTMRDNGKSNCRELLIPHEKNEKTNEGSHQNWYSSFICLSGNGSKPNENSIMIKVWNV